MVTQGGEEQLESWSGEEREGKGLMVRLKV